MIIEKKEMFMRTTTGKSWKSKPDTTKRETITEEYYKNCVDSIQFFNRFGYGASCRGYKKPTAAGYRVYKIVTIAPGRGKKEVRTYYFN